MSNRKKKVTSEYQSEKQQNVKNPKSANPTGLINFKDIELTKSQKQFADKIVKNDIIFCSGPAGTSKTFTALFASLKLLVSDGRYEKILLTKPLEQSGEELGHLPGEIEDKIAPFAYSFYDTMEQLIDSKDVGALVQGGEVKFRPLAYMRGSSFRNSIMILDEAQNCDFRQILMYVTRMGKDSKIIVMGDTNQYDIKQSKMGLSSFMEMIKDIKGVGTHEFEKKDIVRNPILVEITERYDKWKEENKVTGSK